MMEKATFAAGCFWGVEEAYRTLEGVLETTVGYMGGTTENPTYEQVCSDTTGHAEVVQLRYDPARISYRQLLDRFWAKHNPTTLNRQGVDIGTQYRSAIFYHSDEQRRLAEASRDAEQTSGRFADPIVTEIAPATPFWPAEEYHQKYIQKQKPGFTCS
jgi:peptide-methionine (S)-S-oxide reductase